MGLRDQRIAQPAMACQQVALKVRVAGIGAGNALLDGEAGPPIREQFELSTITCQAPAS